MIFMLVHMREYARKYLLAPRKVFALNNLMPADRSSGRDATVSIPVDLVCHSIESRNYAA